MLLRQYDAAAPKSTPFRASFRGSWILLLAIPKQNRFNILNLAL